MTSLPRAGAAAFLAGALLLVGGCSSSSKGPVALPPIETSPPVTLGTLAPNVARPKLPLEFRQVQVSIAATTPIKTLRGSGGSGPTQQCSDLITPRAEQRPDNASEMLFDRRRAACYLLGPSLVPSTSIASARVIYDQTTRQWATVVHFKNDDYATNVVKPLAGKQVATVLAGFVQSALTINPGMTGRDVQIEGGFTREGAVEVAAAILGIAPTSVKVDPTGS